MRERGRERERDARKLSSQICHSLLHCSLTLLPPADSPWTLPRSPALVGNWEREGRKRAHRTRERERMMEWERNNWVSIILLILMNYDLKTLKTVKFANNPVNITPQTLLSLSLSLSRFNGFRCPKYFPTQNRKALSLSLSALSLSLSLSDGTVSLKHHL